MFPSFRRILQLEEEYIKQLCDDIIRVKPDLVITEKGVSDLAQHFLVRAGISVLRRVRKSDNNRIARCCGATIVNRTEELKEEDVGTQAALFEIKKIGDEYFSFITECQDPKACTIVLRGASKDVLNEVERNLQVRIREIITLRHNVINLYKITETNFQRILVPPLDCVFTCYYSVNAESVA